MKHAEHVNKIARVVYEAHRAWLRATTGTKLKSWDKTDMGMHRTTHDLVRKCLNTPNYEGESAEERMAIAIVATLAAA